MAKSSTRIFQVSNSDRTFRRLTFALGLITLGLWTSLEDPFNIVKMWILIIASATTVGFIFFNLKAEFRIRKLAYIPIFAFFAALTISAIFSPNKYQAIFGAQARATGWITYACLILIVLFSRLHSQAITTKVSLSLVQ